MKLKNVWRKPIGGCDPGKYTTDKKLEAAGLNPRMLIKSGAFAVVVSTSVAGKKVDEVVVTVPEAGE